MALDPEELVTLTNHGTMKLRSAVARAMMLLPQERDLATIIRESEPTILRTDQASCGAVGETGNVRAVRMTLTGCGLRNAA